MLQSSSTVTVMIVGFVNSGLMNLTQALEYDHGINIGTTITAQIVSFDIYVLAFPLIGVGALLYFFSKKRFLRYLGKVLLGFGLLLLGLSTMSSAVDPLKTYQPFLDLLVLFGQRPLLGILAEQFSPLLFRVPATTGLVIALAWQELWICPQLAIAVGANIGTCITAVLAGTTAGTSLCRAAIGHVLFNVFGTVLFVILRRPFVSLVGATGASVARQLANAHTLFNVFTTLLVFPFLKHFVRLVTVLVPGRDEVIELKPKFLDDRIVETPGALFAANQEVLRMINVAVDMVEQAISAFIKGDKSLLHQIEQREQVVNTLEKAITAYLAKTNQSSMNVEQAREVINNAHRQ